MNRKKRWLWSGAGLLGALALITVGFRSASAAETAEQKPFRALRGEHRQMMLEKGADHLGISTEKLKEEIKSDKPFYQIAAENGMTYEKVRATHLEEFKTRLNDMVNVGYMTQDQANEVYQQMEQDPMVGVQLGMPHGGPFFNK